MQERTAELAHANRELENSIAEQQQTAMALQEQETWLRAILDSTVDGIITLNSQAKFSAPIRPRRTSLATLAWRCSAAVSMR